APPRRVRPPLLPRLLNGGRHPRISESPPRCKASPRGVLGRTRSLRLRALPAPFRGSPFAGGERDLLGRRPLTVPLAFTWSELAQQIVSGLATGSIYASLALALVIVYRSSGVINFAQGELATLSTYVALTLD